VLRSALEAARACAEDVVGEVEVGGRRLPVPRFSVVAPNRSTRGRIEAMALYAGESVGAVRRVQPAAEIVLELARGAGRKATQHRP
jgi:hypothetical protein